MTFDKKKYNREWARKRRGFTEGEEYRIKRYIKMGKCPVCEMLLTSRYHTNCPFINPHLQGN